uniref:Peptidase C51 domain-containing protein n=1 Tax=viral metagenome TaxID=1070528 RepID=A0A6C0I1G4_9ZZZZ
MRHSLRKNKTSRYSKLKKIVHNSKKIKCVTRFGKNIGNLEDVPAYSNCNNSFESNLNNFISYKNKNVFSGMQWQCVEYARRYLINKLGVTFSSVDGAEDVFDLKTVESIQNGKKYKFKKYKNKLNCKRKNNMPKVNDVIIWARNKDDTPYGHIAVILKIEGDQLFIGEQNWSNDAWTSSSSPPYSYSRILTFKTYNNKCLIIDGNYKILGWKRAMVENVEE